MRRGFTLTELIITIIIIGILVTLGLSQYFPLRERAYDKEATTNLKLISAAEKIYRMEIGGFVNCTDTNQTNERLRLSLPTTKWYYKVDDATVTTFTGKAQRITDTSRVWCMNQTSEEPYQAGCSW